LFEYLATDLPIIYIGDPSSDAASLLRQYPGCYVLASRDLAGIKDALLSCRGERHVRDVSRFLRSKLTERLAAVLNETSPLA
jgi:hypothetical protein